MQFSDTSTKQGLIEDITFITKANTTNYPTSDRTRNINNWYSKVTNWIITSTGRWQWDDSNQTDLPTATTGLVSGQQDYTVIEKLPSASQDWLQIDRVELIDENGDTIKLKPIDTSDVGIAMDELMDTDGTPEYFDFRGSSVFLYPAPDYTKSSALIAYFNRAPLAFVATDTTKKPGFASIFHRVLSLGASFDWALTNGKDIANGLRGEIEIMKNDIKKHYSKRDKYETKKLTRTKGNFK